jgi:hypothetical protein
VKQKVKLLPLVILAVCSIALLATPAQAAPMAAATAASLELSSNSFLEGSPVTIRVYDVTAAGASFVVYFTYDSSGTDTLEAKTSYANKSVLLGSSSDEWVHTMVFEAPTSGAYVRVHVAAAADGSADLASAQIDAVDPESLLPTDLIITVGIALMIILIIVGIVAGLARRGRR